MSENEIIADISYRLKVSDKIKELEEKLIDGYFDDNELIDLVLFYKREISQLEDELNRVYNKLI